MRISLLLTAFFFSFVLIAFLYQQLIVEGEMGPAAIVGSLILFLFILVVFLFSYLSGTKYRESVKNLLVAFGTTVATYLIVDFVAGWLLIVPLSPPLVPDSFRHHILVPDSYAELRQRDFQYIQRTNKLGLRGEETTIEKPAGTKRVLMLGDSFTMGKGVEENETFSVLTEKYVNNKARECGNTTVEVLNGGVDSYSPILSYIQMKRDLVKFEPDIVILNLDNSDLIQEQAYRNQAVTDETGSIVAVPQIAQESTYEKFLSWTTRNLYLTRILLVYTIRAMDHKEVSVRRVVNEFGREHFAHTLANDKDRASHWKDIFESIEKINSISKSIGATFILSTYPWAHQVNSTDWVPGRYTFMGEDEKLSDKSINTIRDYSNKLGIELIETLPYFLDYQGNAPLYFKFDPHWTPEGQDIMATALSEYLIENHSYRWCES